MELLLRLARSGFGFGCFSPLADIAVVPSLRRRVNICEAATEQYWLQRTFREHTGPSCPCLFHVYRMLRVFPSVRFNTCRLVPRLISGSYMYSRLCGSIRAAWFHPQYQARTGKVDNKLFPRIKQATDRCRASSSTCHRGWKPAPPSTLYL